MENPAKRDKLLNGKWKMELVRIINSSSINGFWFVHLSKGLRFQLCPFKNDKRD